MKIRNLMMVGALVLALLLSLCMADTQMLNGGERMLLEMAY